MAKNQVYIDVVIDDKGTTKRVAVNAKKLGIELDKAGVGADKAAAGTDKLGKSSKDLDRNMRGASKMTSNSTKEFSKMRQGMGGLVGTYATLAAQVFAVSAAFQFLSNAADYKNLISGQEALGAVSGTAFKTITNNIIAATDAQIKYGDAARAAAIGSAAGLTSGQLEELGVAAKNVSFALGRDLTDSFNRLVRGVTKAEPELLDELGIILRLETASEKYAEKIGVAASELTAFQRSQAVANEVLEQSERKFAAIEALMDPNAAALQQFAKSFDDLFNAFREGIISGLTPALQFLSKNTLALSASLALFAIPIIKAIIPNLHEWRQESAELQAQHEAHAEQYKADLMEESALLKQLKNDQDALASSAAKVAQAKGQKTDKGGIGYLAGGAGSPQARAAAQKGLKLAAEDLAKHGEVRRGIMQGWTAQEVALGQASFDARTQAATKHLAWYRKGFIGTLVTSSMVGFNAIKVKWAGTMAFMQGAAQVAARTINVAMSLVGIIGVLTMVAAGLKAVYDYFFPLSEEAKRQAEEIDNLTTKYKELGAELERARTARETLTTGSMDVTNIGQALQSADVSTMIDSINAMQGMDPSADGFEKLQKDLIAASTELALIDPRFQQLADSAGDLQNKIGPDMAADLRKVADGFMEAGQRVSQLPETIGKADKAFTSLSKAMIKSNPLDEFIDAEKTVLKDLELRRNSALEKERILKSQALAMVTANNDQMLADEVMFANMNKNMSDYYKKKWDTMSEDEKKAFRTTKIAKDGKVVTRGQQVEGTGTQADVDNIRKRMEQSKKEADADTGNLDDRIDRNKKLVDLRDTQRQAAKDRLDAEAKALEQTTRGVTIQGKINNLEQSRVKHSNKLALAVEAEARAQAALDTAKEEDVDLAKEALEVAKRQTRVARAQHDLAMSQVDAKQEELRLEKELLALKVRNLDLDIQNKALDIGIQREEDAGGGTFASRKNIRAMESQKLQNELTQAQNLATAAAAEYDRVYNDKLKELKDTKALELGVKPEALGETELTAIRADATDQARVETGDAGAQAGLDVQAAQAALDAHNGIYNATIKTMQAEREEIELQLEIGVLTEAQKATAREILRLKEKGLEITPEIIEGIKKEAIANEDVERQLKNREALAENFKNGMAGAFESMINGSKSAKEAFADMAKSMLAQLAKIIAQELMLKAIRLAMPGFFADGGISARDGYAPIYAANGYYGGRNYNKGGIARGPNSGFNARLHGNEAVVPLPHSRKIPVELNGAAGQQNNVTVNVTMNNEGGGSAQSSTAADSANAGRLGDMVAKAVQDELQYQKRSGGILSPYGAA